MGRYWEFIDAKGDRIEVPRWGEGVVGQTPLLKPGQWFEYVSGTALEGGAPGKMQGSLLVKRDGGEEWEAIIAEAHLKINP